MIPDGCVGLPLLAAVEQGIPVIAVRENENRMSNDLRELPFKPGQLIVVNNYLEAVGAMQALRAGVALDSVRRPLAPTTVVKQGAQRRVAEEKEPSVDRDAGALKPEPLKKAAIP